jgi:iron complex outermembrane receptor protein
MIATLRFFPARLLQGLALCSFLLVGHVGEAAQGTQSIAGTVVDQSGGPIAGASVTLSSGSRAVAKVITTGAGEFSLVVPGPGTYTVVVERPLFDPVRVDIQVAGGVDVPAQRVVLQVAALREQVNVVADDRARLALDAVPESSSRMPLTNRELPANVEVLSQARIQELGARTTVEALNRSAGVTFSLTPNGPVRLNLRGFSSDAVSVLHDGVRATASGAQGRNQDSWLFERIEVLSGPASVLYGEGALAGVINFVPKRPVLGERSVTGVVSGGSLDTLRAAGDLNLPLGDKVALRAIASTNRSGGYIDDTDSEFDSGTIGVRVQPSDRLTIDVGVDRSRDALGTAYYGTPLVPAAVATDPVDIIQAPGGLVLDRALRTSNFNVENPEYGADTTALRSQVRYRLSRAFTFTNVLSHYDAQHRFVDNAINFTYQPATGLVARGRSTVINDFEFWAERPVIAADHQVLGRRHRFSVGSEFSRLTSSSFRRLGASFGPINPYAPVRGLAPANEPPSAFPTAGTESSTVDIAAVFLEDAFNLTSRWMLAGGLRYEKSDVDRTTFNARTNAESGFVKSFDPTSWRIGTVVDLTAKTKAYAQRSSAIVPVSGLTLLPLANAAFDLTTGSSVEAGLKSTMFGDRLDFTVSGFRIEQDNIITRDPRDFNISIQGGRRSSKGVEAAVSAAVTPALRVDASHTRLDSRFDELLEAGGVSRAGNTPPGTPETITNLFAAYALRTVPVTITGTVRHEGRSFLDNANAIRVNGHTTLDASVGYRFKAGDLTLRGRNLTDQLYADAASPAVGQVVLGPPRTVDLTFSIRYR